MARGSSVAFDWPQRTRTHLDMSIFYIQKLFSYDLPEDPKKLLEKPLATEFFLSKLAVKLSHRLKIDLPPDTANLAADRFGWKRT